MKKRILLLPALILACTIGICASAQKKSPGLPQLGKSPLKDVIKAMTLEEKAKLVVGMGFRMPAAPRRRNDTSRRAANAFNLPQPDPADNIPEKVPGAAGRTHAIARLGIPSITVSDGPAGVRINPIRNNDSSKTYYATAFPVGTLLASSWDPELVHKVGEAFGNEVREYGVDILLGPGENIHRNPLGGRNFEYYSEDPLVSGTMAAAIINGIQSQGVGTSIKHFVANNQETNRGSVNTIVSQRALRELYLKGFEIAIKKSHPWTVMSSYNKVNGTYTSQTRDLLTTILKNEWGFKGLVMTDWFGGHDPVAQMNAGNDLLMPGVPTQTQAIIAGVKKGEIKMEQLDANVERILKVVMMSPEFKKYKYSDKPDLKKHARVSRMAAAEGMVLLKDDGNALPLKGKKVALFGNASYDLVAGGTGSGNVNKAYTISLVQGLNNAGYTINNDLKHSYESYISEAKARQPHNAMSFFMLPPPIPQMEISSDIITKEAADADEAIITIGRNAGEGADRKVDNDFDLMDSEKALIKSIGDAFHAKGKKLVVVINAGGVIETASWRDQVDGILLAWQPGLEAGNAITDVLSGKVDPSGKLATTFPVNYSDDPTAKNFPGKELPMPEGQKPSMMMGRPAEVVYQEGIFVGYRYYNTFDVKPAYPFGYGLSYTKFKYSGMKLSSKTFNGSVTASITVTNTGKVTGREVVELYVSAPVHSLQKPAEELRAFGKTRSLKPGESQTLSFTLAAKDLESFDTAQSAWVAEEGAYTVRIGASSEDIKGNRVFNLPKSIVVEKVHDVLKPQVEIDELKK
ncbi:MAG: glycoside hydrolase family 3 C-terminal domain-containing protein [Bacteroidetes bacterium]|nr:glycoside hydrolase family 3 C-terminal domain-containing protein [Bacteroidota bacterium]